MTYAPRSSDRGAYQSNDVLCRSPESLVVLLYQRLLTELSKADQQIAAGDAAGKGDSLSRASGIVFELLASLDRDQGGELASRLVALYSYFICEIQDIDRSVDRDRLRRLMELIAPLHDSWSEAADAIRRDRDGEAGS